jgi:quercetin dioxygenase-like cupin family protein
MKRKKMIIPLAAVALTIVLGALFLVRPTWATPGWGVTPEPVAAGQMPEVVRAKFKDEGGFERGFDVSRVEMIKYTVVPGGYFGWHQHGGPVMGAIAAGELTFYDGDDPSCTGTVYSAGSGFFETGDHTHIARNEGTVDVVVYTAYMLPQGAAVRVDMPNPGVCPF